jgi:hypothetical protein
MLIIDRLTVVRAVDNLSHELIFKDQSSTVKNLVKYIVDKIFYIDGSDRPCPICF